MNALSRRGYNHSWEREVLVGQSQGKQHGRALKDDDQASDERTGLSREVVTWAKSWRYEDSRMVGQQA